MKRFHFTLTILLLSFSGYAQNTFQYWYNNFNSVSTTVGETVVHSGNNGYSIAGIALDKAFILETDSNGTVISTKVTDFSVRLQDNNSNPDNAFGNVLIKTADGGYAMSGTAQSGNNDFFIVKLDSNYNRQWVRTMGGSGEDWNTSLVQTNDGGYALTGYTHSFGTIDEEVYVVKLDGAGSLQWSKTIGGAGDARGYSIVQTRDSGFAITGILVTVSNQDAYVLKLNSFGDLQWTRTIDRTFEDRAYSIIQTSDNGYLVAGISDSSGNPAGTASIIKLDSSGGLDWMKVIYGSLQSFFSVIQSSDGGYALAGYTSLKDVYVVKVDSSGNISWAKGITGPGNHDDVAESIIQNPDGSYVVSGYTNSYSGPSTYFSRIYLIKLDANGFSCGNTFNTTDVANLSACSLGTWGALTDVVSSIDTVGDMITGNSGIHLICNSGSLNTEEYPDSKSQLKVFPNPSTTGIVHFLWSHQNKKISRLTISDLTGRTVFASKENAEEFAISLTAFGIYFYFIETVEGELFKGKIIRN